MSSLLSRFTASFTPSFLTRFKNVSVGQGVLYYFSVWCLVWFLATIAGLALAWKLSAPERIAPFLSRIPAFELRFEDNKLVGTSFSEDPYVMDFGDAQVFISATASDLPEWYEERAGFYLLRDNAVINQPEQAAQKITRIDYADMEIGDTTINNAFLEDKVLTIYPQVRKTALSLLIPVSLLVGLAVACFFFLLSFFWSLVVFLMSKIGSLPRLTYEQSLVFVHHLFLPVFLLAGAFLLSWIYFLFLPTLLFVAAFLFNSLGSPSWHSLSTRKK